MKKFFTFILLFIGFGPICLSQYIIRGKVADEELALLRGVTVNTAGTTFSVLTDSLGNYAFPSKSLNIPLSFSHVGFESFSINAAADSIPLVVLVRSSILLTETRVNSFELNSKRTNVPAAVTLLSKASLERFGSESFIPAVNTVPGVKMDERSPGSYRLSIRGNLLRSPFGVRNVKVYWNGIPFTDASGTTYINQLAFNSIGKMEILKGPSGSMYGAGTGGVVLLSSDLTSKKEKSLSIQSGAGSYGMFAAAAVYRQSGDKLNSVLSFSHQQADGYRDHTTMRRDVANFTGTYLVNAKQNINANIFYSDLYYKTPGGLTKAEMTANPQQARPAAGVFQSAQTQKAALYLKTIYAGVANEYRFNSHWNNTTSVYGSHTDFKNPTIRNYEKKEERGFGARSVTKYSSRSFTGVFGVEYQKGFSNTGTYGNKRGEIDTLQYRDEIDSRQVNIFLQTDISLLQTLILSAGISYNNFYYGFTRVSEFPNSKESSNFSPQFVPRVSLLQKIKSDVSVYVAFSKGYSPPSIDEVHASDGNFNKQLRAETGTNYEAGLKADLFKSKLSIDASYYIFRLGNTIVSRRDSSGADYFVNAGKTKQQGFELALGYLAINNSNRFLRSLKFWTNYTNIYARFVNYEQGVNKFDGNKLTGTSPNIFLCGIDLNTSVGIYTNLTYNYTDQVPLNDANSFYGDHYNLFFAKLGCRKDIGKKLNADLYVSYDKSFNQPYSLGNDLNAAANRFYNPSSPQNVYAGLRLKFIL